MEAVYRTDNNQDAIDQEMDAHYSPHTDKIYLQPRNPHDYLHLHTTVEHSHLTQYTVKKGLTLFVEAGLTVLRTVPQKNYDQKVIEQKNSKEVSREEKKEPFNI